MLLGRNAWIGSALFAVFVLSATCTGAQPDDAPAARLFAAAKFTQAAGAYASAMRHDLQKEAPRLGLIRSLMRLDRWEEALSTAQNAAKRFPQSGDVQGMLALTLMRAGRPEQSAATAEHASALNGDSYWALVAQGRVAVWNHHSEAARTALRHAISLHPDWPEARYYLVDALSGDEVTSSDIDDLTAYLKLNPKGHPNDIATDVLPTRLPLLRTFLNDPPYCAAGPITEAQMQAADRGEHENVSLAVTFEHSGDYVILPVLLNGQKLRLMFDTGGGSDITLNQAAADRLKLPQLAVSTVYGVSGKEPSRLYRSNDLKIGSETFRSVSIESVGNAVGDFDGIIGVNIFDNYVVTLDFAHDLLTLTRGKTAAAPAPDAGDHLVATPFHYVEGDVLIPVSIEEHPVWAIVDSGADDYALMSMHLAHVIASLRSKNRYKEGAIDGKIGIGETQTRQQLLLFNDAVALRIDNMSGGPFTVKMNPAVGTSVLDSQISSSGDFQLDALLGIPFLRTAERVTFDYPHQLLTMEIAGAPSK